MSARELLPERIVTERLVLRAPVETDLGDIIALANNPVMVKTTATLPFPYTQSDGRAFLEQARTSPAMRAYAVAGADDRFLGCIMFKLEEGKNPEIGYWFGQPHWGLGYASEAVAGLMQAAAMVDGFAVVDARVLASNPASQRVLEKVGFVTIERTLAVVERHLGQPLLILRWRAA